MGLYFHVILNSIRCDMRRMMEFYLKFTSGICSFQIRDVVIVSVFVLDTFGGSNIELKVVANSNL